MAELKENKRRLSINLSFFGPSDQNAKPTAKSPRNFEEPNGVVGLGILAALNDLDQTQHPFSAAKSTRAAVLAISPRSLPIPVISKTMSFDSSKFGGTNLEEAEGMELAEEYTCVISHVGNNMIKKREYFDGNLGNASGRTHTCRVSNGLFSASSPPALNRCGHAEVSQSADFLNACYLCKKQLHGLDIFMYRGEKAFCSAECRFKQMSIDEHQENYNSGAMKSLEYSVSPCCSPMQLFAGVAMA